VTGSTRTHGNHVRAVQRQTMARKRLLIDYRAARVAGQPPHQAMATAWLSSAGYSEFIPYQVFAERYFKIIIQRALRSNYWREGKLS
jgi:hypothetical protein